MRLATANFLGSQNLSATGWALRAAQPGISSHNNAFGVFIDYPNDLWSGRLGLREVQSRFAPTVGFVTRTDAPFQIRPDITLPIGAQYDYTRYALRGRTANRRTLAVEGRYETGGFYSGTRSQTVMAVMLRARPGYILYLNGEWNRIDLAEGRFATRLYRVIGETQFSAWIAWVNNFQFDTQSAALGWQSRFRWIMKPSNDLYVVYTHNWLDDPLLNRFATLDRRAASKVLHTHRF
jgi:hypothetical protein